MAAKALPVSRAAKKDQNDEKLRWLLREFSKIPVVGPDKLGFRQFQRIRRGLRGDSAVLIGKNTVIERSVKIFPSTTGNDPILNLLPTLVVGAPSRVGLVILQLPSSRP